MTYPADEFFDQPTADLKAQWPQGVLLTDEFVVIALIYFTDKELKIRFRGDFCSDEEARRRENAWLQAWSDVRAGGMDREDAAVLWGNDGRRNMHSLPRLDGEKFASEEALLKVWVGEYNARCGGMEMDDAVVLWGNNSRRNMRDILL